MNVIWIIATSLIYMLLLILVYFFKEKSELLEGKILKNLVLVSYIGIALQVVTLIILFIGSIEIQKLFYKSILIFYILYFLLASCYVGCVTRREIENKEEDIQNFLRKISTVSIVIFVISLLCISWLNMDVERIGNKVLLSGACLNFMFIPSGLIVAFWLYNLIRSFRNLKASNLLVAVVALICVGVIVTLVSSADSTYILFATMNTLCPFMIYILKEESSTLVTQESEENTLDLPEELMRFLDDEIVAKSKSIINNSLDEMDVSIPVEAPQIEVVRPIDLTGKNILMVDDNEFNLKIGAKILKSYNATVKTLNSGIECVKRLKAGEHFDLIFMDDMMPNMSGVETLHKIIHEIKDFDTPIIVLTANTAEGLRNKYLNLGFTDYLTKPIIKVELNESLRSVFGLGTNVLVGADSQTTFETVSNNNDISYLRQNNIDVDDGIKLLGDLDMYNEMMEDFYNVIERRLEDLEKYKNSKDSKNYAIQVHSLKSDSKYLGFTTLAKIAYEHEKKSKENDLKYINANFKELEREVRSIIVIIKKYLSK